MSFESIAEFLNMGGHALYVWLAYGAALVVVIGNLIAPLRRGRRFFITESQRARRDAHAAGTTETIGEQHASSSS